MIYLVHCSLPLHSPLSFFLTVNFSSLTSLVSLSLLLSSSFPSPPPSSLPSPPPVLCTPSSLTILSFLQSLRFPYTRPHFLQLGSEDEIQVTADHAIRPIICPRDISRLPWNSGYAEWVLFLPLSCVWPLFCTLVLWHSWIQHSWFRLFVGCIKKSMYCLSFVEWYAVVFLTTCVIFL